MVRPLERRSQEGRLYVRPRRFDPPIEEALALDRATLAARSKLGTSSPGWIAPEVLVHVLRLGHREGHPTRVAPLFGVLLERSRKILLKFQVPEDVVDEVLGDLGLMFAEDAAGVGKDALDLLRDLVRLQLARHGDPTDAREAQPADGRMLRPAIAQEAPGVLNVRTGATPSSQEPILDVGRVLDAIADLPAEEHEAVRLVDILGYEVESEDATKVTAATLTGVSGRTIRKRLAKARTKLETLQSEPNEEEKS